MSKEEARLKPDSKGQLELDNIDTALGVAAEKYAKATAAVDKAKSAKDDAALDVIEEMKKAKIRTLKFKGDTLQYQPGHSTPEKLKYIPGQD